MKLCCDPTVVVSRHTCCLSQEEKAEAKEGHENTFMYAESQAREDSVSVCGRVSKNVCENCCGYARG